MLKWYEETGDNEDIVISSRVRLARNLSKYPFPVRLSKAQAKGLLEELKAYSIPVIYLTAKLSFSFYGFDIGYR